MKLSKAWREMYGNELADQLEALANKPIESREVLRPKRKAPVEQAQPEAEQEGDDPWWNR